MGFEKLPFISTVVFFVFFPKHHQSLPSPAKPNIAMDVIYARGSEKWMGLEDDVLSLATWVVPGVIFQWDELLNYPWSYTPEN